MLGSRMYMKYGVFSGGVLFYLRCILSVWEYLVMTWLIHFCVWGCRAVVLFLLFDCSYLSLSKITSVRGCDLLFRCGKYYLVVCWHYDLSLPISIPFLIVRWCRLIWIRSFAPFFRVIPVIAVAVLAGYRLCLIGPLFDGCTRFLQSRRWTLPCFDSWSSLCGCR